MPVGSQLLHWWYHSALSVVLNLVDRRREGLARSIVSNIADSSLNDHGGHDQSLSELNAAIESLFWIIKSILIRNDVKYEKPGSIVVVGFEMSATTVSLVDSLVGNTWQEKLGQLILKLIQTPCEVVGFGHSFDASEGSVYVLVVLLLYLSYL